MRRLVWIIPLVLVAAVAAALLRRRGVTVAVTNAGATPMRDVRVDVTGRSYPLGDLPPHASRSVRVNPTGESYVIIRYAGADGGHSRSKLDAISSRTMPVASTSVSRVGRRCALTIRSDCPSGDAG